MTKYFFLLLTLAGCFFTATAQKKLLFSNNNSGKMIVVHEDDMLKLVYRGYLGQVQEIYGKVDNISDSFIRFENNWTVRTSDLLGFRKFSKHRELLKSATTIVVIVGVLISSSYIIVNNPGMNIWERWGILFGMSFGGSLITDALFPEKIKNLMSAGWVVKVED